MERFLIIFPEHLGQGTPVSKTKAFVNLHSGYPGHARNLPNLLLFITRFLPQLGQISSVTSSGTLILVSLRDSSALTSVESNKS